MAKKNEPRLVKFVDAEEKELYELIESDAYRPGENRLTPAANKKLQRMAQATINEQRTRISLRLPNTDLQRLKAKALREGMPYQTLINSILHKAVSG